MASTYAKRWAAKEACSKALGTGLRMGIAWKDMSVSNLRSGQPVMHLTGWAAERLAQMTPPGHRAVVHVTLTDDHPWAQAFVVIEAVLLDGPGSRLTGPDPRDPDPAKSHSAPHDPAGRDTPDPTARDLDPGSSAPTSPNRPSSTPTELMPPKPPLP